MKKGKLRSYERSRGIYGYVFISLWLIGIVFFFAVPFVRTIWFSFNSLADMEPGNLNEKWVGLENYRRLFLGDAQFLPAFTETVRSTIVETPLICIFSLFLAILLNQRFRGRTAARAIFFLPVIIASGVVMDIVNGDQFLNMIMSGQRAGMMFEVTSTQDLLYQAGVNPVFVDYIIDTVNRLFYLVWHSGLQSISASLYEVAKVEGANAWVAFWKITLPMLSPMLLVNLIYTVIDSYINSSNPLFKLIDSVSLEFDYVAAMSVFSFAAIFLIIGIVYFILNRWVYYAVD